MKLNKGTVINPRAQQQQQQQQQQSPSQQQLQSQSQPSKDDDILPSTTISPTSPSSSSSSAKKKKTTFFSSTTTIICPIVIFLVSMQFIMTSSVLETIMQHVSTSTSMSSTTTTATTSSTSTTNNDSPYSKTSRSTLSNNNNNNNNNNYDIPYNDELGPLNVIIFYPDDWRYDVIGDVQPPGILHTPFLTKLAKEGIRFTHNAVTTSICWISRATLFTGRYVSQHQSPRLFCPIFTMPHIWNGSWPFLLQKLGNYFVGHIGKWQYHSKNGPGQFFNFSTFHEGQHWYNVQGKHVHANDRARNEAIQFLRQRPKDHNFALTIAFYPPKALDNTNEPGGQWEPHPSYRAMYETANFTPQYDFTEAFSYIPNFLQTSIGKARYDTRYKTKRHYEEGLRNYYALVSHIDSVCRDVVKEIEDQGELNRTLIIITSDNGLMMGAHGLAGKWHPFQESIRVPLIIYDPRMASSKRGTTDDSYTLNIDLAATILGAAKIPLDPRIQGRDLGDIYIKRKNNYKQQQQLQQQQQQNEERKLQLQQSESLSLSFNNENDDNSNDNDSASFGIDKIPWRQDFFYEFPLPEFPDSTALITRQYKYIRWNSNSIIANNPNHKSSIMERGEEMLFDLLNDPYEFHDLTLTTTKTATTTTTTRTLSSTNFTTTTIPLREADEYIPIQIMEQMNTPYRPLANISDILVTLRARHDELRDISRQKVPGEKRYTCERNMPEMP